MVSTQQKPNLRRKKTGVNCIGRPAGSCGSSGDDRRYQDWYRYGEIEGELQILGAATQKLTASRQRRSIMRRRKWIHVRMRRAKLWAPNDVRTNGALRRLVLENLREWMPTATMLSSCWRCHSRSRCGHLAIMPTTCCDNVMTSSSQWQDMS